MIRFFQIIFAAIIFILPLTKASAMEFSELVNWKIEVDWKELKGDHFIVFYDKEDDKFAKQVLASAEDYYKRISQDLGYERRSNFWQWDNRVKIYIYPTQGMFQADTGQETWSHGAASYREKAIWTYDWGKGFIEDLLPHEITHLIFRDYVGFKGEIPLWLDEGVAQWQESSKRDQVEKIMPAVMKDGKAFSLKELTQLDIRGSTDEERVTIFYIQAVSVVSYFVKQHGTANFITFCRQLRDGKSLDEALRFTFPTSIRTLDDLEAKWKKFVTGLP